MNDKWSATGCCLAGVVMLAIQCYMYLDVGLISAWLIGGGVGLLVIGLAKWFDWLDDGRAARKGITQVDDPLPSADEYDRRFQLGDSADSASRRE